MVHMQEAQAPTLGRNALHSHRSIPVRQSDALPPSELWTQEVFWQLHLQQAQMWSISTEQVSPSAHCVAVTQSARTVRKDRAGQGSSKNPTWL